MQPLTIAEGELIDTFVCGEDEDISRRVEDRRANLAKLEVFLHLLQDFRRQVIIKIAGDVIPDMLAIYNHENHPRFGLICFNCGANFLCSNMRAR